MRWLTLFCLDRFLKFGLPFKVMQFSYFFPVSSAFFGQILEVVHSFQRLPNPTSPQRSVK